MISVIVPVLDEAERLGGALAPLQAERGGRLEIIVVDGGSRDNSLEIARPLCDRVLMSRRGRARQMNAGARAARGDTLLFLHADTRLTPPARARLSALEQSPWGRFDVTLKGREPLFRLISTLMNLRSRLTGIATGDQAIFVRRDLFWRIGGYPEIALMEDLALSRHLKNHARPVCLRETIEVSARYWRQRGIIRGILTMWAVRAAWSLGASPRLLHRIYYGKQPS